MLGVVERTLRTRVTPMHNLHYSEMCTAIEFCIMYGGVNLKVRPVI